MAVEFKVLGSLEVWVDGHIVPINAPKQRVVLAALLLHAGRPVRTSQLVEYLWGDNAPKDSHNAVQTHVTRLRRALSVAELIRTVEGGYFVDVDPDRVDLLRFRSLVARASGESGELKAETLREAVGLWRGRPLLDVPSDELRDAECPALEAELLQALEWRIDVDLSQGRHGSVIGELRALTAEYPFRERFWGQLMLALYRSGQQAEALAAFRDVVQRTGLDLSSEVGAELRELHQKMLTGEVEQAAEPDVEARVVPQQLPADLGDFVGRAEMIEHVVSLLDPEAEGARLVVVSGPPGVGKSAFAVRVGHRVKDRFPDGQLHVNLHGYSRGVTPTAEQVLARFLRALGTRPQEVPTELEEQAKKLRATMATRRVLVVLDNAADAEQVRPLLRALPGCSVLITSRNELRALAGEGSAHPLSLPTLSVKDSGELLGELVGGRWGEADVDARRELATLCGNLPLALRIAGANLAFQAIDVRAYIDRMKSGDLLDSLTIEGDDHAAVRAAFELSYATLDPDGKKLFAALALVPGVDFTSWVAAALTDRDLGWAGVILDKLSAANLIREHRPGRYQFHDLIRLYSHKKYSLAGKSFGDSRARRALFESYLSAVNNAAKVLNPEMRCAPADLEVPAGLEVAFEGATEALSWFDDERANLIAMVRSSSELGPLRYSWELVFSMASYLRHRRYGSDWLELLEYGRAAADEANDGHGRALMCTGLGVFKQAIYESEQSVELHGRALAMYRLLGDRVGEAQSYTCLGVAHALLGNQVESVDYLLEAELIFRELGESHALTNVLMNLGAAYAHSGDIDLARGCLERALALAKELEVLHIQGISLSNLGLMAREGGRVREARALLEQALDVWHRLAARHGEAAALDELALTHLFAGDVDQASIHVGRSLEIAIETGNKLKEAEASGTLAEICRRRGDLEEALLLQQKSVHVMRRIKFLPGLAMSLVDLSKMLLAHDRVSEAEEAASEALRISLENDIRLCEPMARTALAECYARAGEPAVAVEYGERALEQHRKLHHQVWEARTLRVVGEALRAAGDVVGAREHWERAVEMFAGMGMPEADGVRELLERVR
ncbi:AfsR/SARP family transcriptional regulator [Allokutzneria oryzae]|uniref:Tetratricopeptide repeat protein n=1 Tax=Allokutzneria oryzae TaxID=1378989 RepID=A0ABV6A6V7_9PSEU